MLYCKNGRLRSLRRRHKRLRSIPWSCGGFSRIAAFYPSQAFGGRALPTRARQSGFAVPGRRTRYAAPLHLVRRLEPCNSRARKSSIRCLQEEGVEYVFGYPGGAVLNIYDELFKQDKVKHVLVRHEQGAVHAADGYSRSSHKVGVALVTSGPGVTNAVTGIATAYMDSIPMVILTGQVPTHAIGQDAFQECDTVGITRPCVKHNFLVKDVKDLAATIKKAFYLAATGRPGPGARRHSEGRDAGVDRVHLSEDGRRCARTTRSPRATPGRSRRRCSCCSRRSGRWSTPAAA